MGNVIEISRQDEVEAFFREEVTLLGNPSLHPYSDAVIKITTINPIIVHPTAKYVLRDNLDRLVLSYNSGMDIFNLKEIVTLDCGVSMCPPVLELWSCDPYNSVPVIVDGGHRLFLALKLGLSVTCILISGCIVAPLPVLPLNWSEVAVCNSVPKDKRNYNPDLPDGLPPEHFYRVPIPGSSGPRVSSENKIY